ncbi:hypothetical protein [Photobacterium piscicola]|uniref:hypothetical protein n=1 Tax=Photobacterium piscicola TaxID=1378299 RepID=UPI0038CF43B2
MNKHQQSGMTTLLITSMLLIVALLFSLASYKNLFYQIKRTQNEVLARQAHWAAEGGLECGFSQIQKAGNISDAKSTFIDCKSTLNLADVNVSIDDENYINSEYVGISNKIIKKKINLSSRLAGAIQARSDLKLIGDYDIYPDVEDVDSNGKYKCVSIRYSNNFYYENSGKELEVFNPKKDGPYNNFPENAECIVKTHLKENSSTEDNITKLNIKGDFVFDDTFDPFENAFGASRNELANIKKEFIEIDGSITECDKKISDAFLINNKVWVNGHCDLKDGRLVGGLNKTARLLVIENGIFATYGAVEFYGMIYHLYTDLIDDISVEWNGISSGDTLGANDKKKAVYYQAGSFVPVGGLVLDSPGRLSVFNSSMSFNFKGDASPNDNSKISWIQGSWHDFEYQKNNRL